MMNPKLKHVLTYILASFTDLSLGMTEELEGDSPIRRLAAKPTSPYAEFAQLGEDIDGRDDYPNGPDHEEDGDSFGNSVAMNSDGSRVAVGAPGNGYCSGYAGYVDVFQLEFADDGSPKWMLLGNSIIGRQDRFGSVVGINGAGTRVVIGVAGDFYTYNPSMVVFDLDQTTDPPTWKMVGKRVPEIDDCYYACDGGVYVAISQNGKHVTFEGDVYALNEAINTWEVVGTGLENCSVSGFSADGGRVKCGGSVYELDEETNQWSQVGLAVVNGSPYSELNENGDSLAVIPKSSNFVDVYQLDDDLNWEKIGNSITSTDDWKPRTLSINADGGRVAIGATSVTSSYMRLVSKVDVFNYDKKKDTWIRVGSTLEEEHPYDNGHKVSMSSDGKRLAIGAPSNDDSGRDAGHVRAYEMQKYKVYQIKSSHDFGNGKTWCMHPKKMKSGALVKVKPCKGNKKQQKWFHDDNNQIRLRSKPWLCAKYEGRAVLLKECNSNSNMVALVYDKNKNQIYTEKANGDIYYVGIDLQNKNVRLYLPKSSNPTLNSWTMNRV